MEEENKIENNEELQELDFIKEAEKYDVHYEEDKEISPKTKLSLAGIIFIFVLIMLWTNLKTIKFALGITVLLSITILIINILSANKIDIHRYNEKKLNGLIITISTLELIFTTIEFITFISLENIKFTDKNICPYSSVTNCTDNKDGTSTCNFLNKIDIPCSTKIVKNKERKNA